MVDFASRKIEEKEKALTLVKKEMKYIINKKYLYNAAWASRDCFWRVHHWHEEVQHLNHSNFFDPRLHMLHASLSSNILKLSYSLQFFISHGFGFFRQWTT